jgi:hypothetical protein
VKPAAGHPDLAWTEVPLVNLPKKIGTSVLGAIILNAAIPDIEFAEQKSEYSRIIQFGYEHVRSFHENGAHDATYPVYTGHGIIWTDETIIEGTGAETSRIKFRLGK